MSQERKKVMIYLRPEAYANEKAASEKIKKHSDMARTALLAGLALGEVDSRLPGLLASLLTEDNNPELIRKMLASFLELPVEERPASIEPVKEQVVAKSASARNLADSLPD
ncbi:plasmid partitioning/stability family protein [Escherichia coli]|nr:plasmid partitioning/stability family protein [Escherichia coli]